MPETVALSYSAVSKRHPGGTSAFRFPQLCVGCGVPAEEGADDVELLLSTHETSQHTTMTSLHFKRAQCPACRRVSSVLDLPYFLRLLLALVVGFPLGLWTLVALGPVRGNGDADSGAFAFRLAVTLAALAVVWLASRIHVGWSVRRALESALPGTEPFTDSRAAGDRVSNCWLHVVMVDRALPAIVFEFANPLVAASFAAVNAPLTYETHLREVNARRAQEGKPPLVEM